MKITADAGCHLTEAAEVAQDKRTYRQTVIVATMEEAAQWRQVTDAERKEMEAQAALFGSQEITPSYLAQEEHEGTADDPIPWQMNMELYEGKYYTDKGVKYLCIRDSGMGLSFALADLVSGGFVQVVNE